MNAYPWGLLNGKFWCVDSGFVTANENAELFAIVECRRYPTEDSSVSVMELGRARFKMTAEPDQIVFADVAPYLITLEPDLVGWQDRADPADFNYPVSGLVFETMFLRGSHLVLKVKPEIELLSMHWQIEVMENLGRDPALFPFRLHWNATFPEAKLPYRTDEGLPNRFQPIRHARLYFDFEIDLP